MRIGNRFARGAALAAPLLAALCFATSEDPPGASAAAQGGAQAKATTTAANGLRTVTFDTTPGTIKVHLPDDMAAGDTVSGTVVAEPRGGTEAERARNLDALKGYAVEVGGQKVSPPQGGFTWVVPDTPVKLIRITEVNSGQEVATAPVPTQAARGGKKPKKGFVTGKGGDAIAAQSESADDAFQLPTLGQQGRAIEIFGPFDGDASNTSLSLKLTGNVPNGSGLIRPLAESPGKIVFESPTNFTGPAEILLKEGGVEARGGYRNLGVRLSAPKTNLARGERTTLTVEVSGLGGIRGRVPLQLDSKGVIRMDGGNFQNLWIKPEEVRPDGRYTTTRDITGQQAGGFTVTATVIVKPFDMCLQDDRSRQTTLLWNSFTGDYVFSTGPASNPALKEKEDPKNPCLKKTCYGCNTVSNTKGPTVNCDLVGGTCTINGRAGTFVSGDVNPAGAACYAIRRGGGTSGDVSGVFDITSLLRASSSGNFSTLATGKVTMKGCIITLSHDAPDRRVFARLDVCARAGSGEVRPSEPTSSFSINDANTADNACPGK